MGCITSGRGVANMKRIIRRVVLPLLLTVIFVAGAGIPHAAPVRSGSTDTISDRKAYIPYHKNLPLPGKAIGVLAADCAPILAIEGRAGPADQLCFSSAGSSYRWVYVPVDKNATVGRVTIAVGPTGERKLFENLSLASPSAVKRWEINSPFALVEMEVNGGAGSPAVDAFVATNMRRLDGTKEFPLKVDDVIADLRKRYGEYLTEKASTIDESMNEAIKTPLGLRKLTGPREKSDLMFVTWLPERERLRVSFRTTIVDGEYQYANDIRIEMRTMPVPRPGVTRATTAASQGFRFGKQFRTEFGVAYEVSKTGNVVSTLILPVETTVQNISPPAGLGGATRTMATMSVQVRPAETKNADNKPAETKKAP